MKLPPRYRPVAVGVGIVVALYGSYYVMYARPMGRVGKELASVVAGNNDIAAAVRDRSRVKDGLKEFAAKTIGATGDEADARFRSLLSEIAISSGLSKSSVQVNTDRAERMVNPGGTSKLTTKLKDDLKKQTDFWVIKGELTGTGPLEGVLRAMATIRAQPWAHRVESFSIKPEDKDRQKYSLRISVATLIMPDLAPAGMSEPVVTVVADGGRGLWSGIAQKNVFKEPAPVVVAAPSVDPPAPGPGRPGWADWKLTGVVESRLGTEVLLIHTKSGQRMSLGVGAAVSEAKFVGGGGEKAVFEIGGEKFEVFNGQTLEQRRPTGG